MDRAFTGEEYARAITAKASDRRARSAFQALVLASARPGAKVYDFGAGTGIDARFYAEKGLAVGAYDVDPRMCDCFAIHCRDLLETGHVTLDTGTYPQFLASRRLNGGRLADLVVADFAPLNLIEDLPALFARFHSLLAPDGLVLASVLSPWFIGDLRYGWWWRNAARLLRTGRYAVGGSALPVIRRRISDFAAQCAPHFALERVYPGLPRSAGAEPRGIDLPGCGATAWLRVTRCRYMFLLFRRAASGKTSSAR